MWDDSLTARDGLARGRDMRRLSILIACRDCGLEVRNLCRGYCAACYRWHLRHGWDATRTLPVLTCRDCGLGVRLPRRGYCDACYHWHHRHGWNAVRPIRPTHCLECGQIWGRVIPWGRGCCTRCYVWHQRHGWTVPFWPNAASRVAIGRVGGVTFYKLGY